MVFGFIIESRNPNHSMLRAVASTIMVEATAMGIIENCRQVLEVFAQFVRY